jgi:hypothetical protein
LADGTGEQGVGLEANQFPALLVVPGSGDAQDSLHVGVGSHAGDDRGVFCDILLLGGEQGERGAGGDPDQANISVTRVRQFGDLPGYLDRLLDGLRPDLTPPQPR